jgi:hypothetical protein
VAVKVPLYWLIFLFWRLHTLDIHSIEEHLLWFGLVEGHVHAAHMVKCCHGIGYLSFIPLKSCRRSNLSYDEKGCEEGSVKRFLCGQAHEPVARQQAVMKAVMNIHTRQCVCAATVYSLIFGVVMMVMCRVRCFTKGVARSCTIASVSIGLS